MESEILQRLHFRELALRFLDSYNPQCDKAIVIADAILSWNGPLDTSEPMRYQASDFVRQAVRIIENTMEPAGKYSAWLIQWNKKYGIKNLPN